MLNIISVEVRRKNFDLCLVFKLLNAIIDAHELLNVINFNVTPRNTKQIKMFNINFHRTNYGYNSLMSQLCREANIYQLVLTCLI